MARSGPIEAAADGGNRRPSSGVVLLAGECPATNAIFHALTRAFGDVTVVLEAPVSRWSLLKRRTTRLGATTVAGQVLFSALAVPLLTRRGRTRVAAIAAEHGLDLSPIDQPTVRVPSVNSDEARAVLRRLAPTAVVVSGTRIISSDTLACVDAPFINLHAGVTPQYRGVHGGYWALADGRPQLVGSTVHLIDAGIDTGPILSQATFAVSPADSFATYPYLHLAAGLPPLVSAVGSILAGQDPPSAPPLASDAPSRLHSHPTLWSYLATRVRRGVA